MSEHPGRRTWGQRAMLGVSVALVIGLVCTAAGLGYAYTKYSRLARVQLGTVLGEEAPPSEPRNFLIVGIDSAANLDPDDPVRYGRDAVSGLRSDTMLILRVDPSTEQAHLLSLPRDLWVPLASGGRQRINAAIQLGGPEELIATIEGYLGISVHHYLQVDFAAFRRLVDVIDGVDVWFEAPARDPMSGLQVTEPGCVRLRADQALAYVRSRHFQSQVDGRWRTDPTGDLGRMSRQQDFIIRALRRAVSRGARNPVTLDRLIDAGLAAVAVDDRLTADDILVLASRFRSFDPDELQRHTLPVSDARIGGAEVLQLRADEAQPVLDLFRGTDPQEVTPRGVRVQVLNGTGRPGEAATASAGLAAAGFTTVGTGDADRYGAPRTVVRYTAGNAAAADLVARHLDPGAVLEEVTGELPADVVVLTGADFTGVRSTPRPPAPTTTTSASVTTEGTAPSSTSSSTSTSTSTTVVGMVPEPPPGVDC